MGKACDRPSTIPHPAIAPTCLRCARRPQNSNVHKHRQTTLAVDILRQKEDDAKREKKRERTAQKMAEQQNKRSAADMMVDDEDELNPKAGKRCAQALDIYLHVPNS